MNFARSWMAACAWRGVSPQRAIDTTIRIAVDDSGPGIPQEEQDRIFRPFWSRDGHGTGLGLAIARELATALGGEIELQTQAGKGSRFELVLPANRMV